MSKGKIAVIGAGIGGLTAAALLAKRGYDVTVYEQAAIAGGCASTFKRRGFTFDVGATQVAGLEAGGIHQRIFQELDVALPEATVCDPACAVFLPGETEPINVWRDAEKWEVERLKQFPKSEKFWHLLKILFAASWQFQGRDPVVPPRNPWDIFQLIKAFRLDTLITVPFALMTVLDALKLCGVAADQRLKTFLDLQLKLYSQVDSSETALLYGATALAVSQTPQGLFHLQGSMQALSDRLIEALEKHEGKLLTRHRIKEINLGQTKPQLTVFDQRQNEIVTQAFDHVVANTTVQDLIKISEHPPESIFKKIYQKRIENLPDPSGAFVIYLGVKEAAIPKNCPPHLQFLYDYDQAIGENNSLFVSVSKPNDGRAPEGHRTIIASSFVDPDPWFGEDYAERKERYTQEAIAKLNRYFDLSPENIIVQEAGTPRTFAFYTARHKGFVGGVGQRISTFAPFGFATRTPFKNVWLVGDSVHPGEGTAGVSYSALTAVRQIEQVS
ncbi:C-3',4' desaturase CrtD [Picosynechococcus sp. PCC 11901]|uniref:C-3',4' desaturase CrtD n=1 Tax=Picosynechococcus sp. PCC 11901 TaxID=2579791 RepID=UPI0010FBDFC0|nr:C-3',4' desaturase CrtD [Picosynechococcus sp. PCC 11901]QCS50162.1 C-3',4' desaturase CrtD [Picosynechococcus sp. PCC 11901]